MENMIGKYQCGFRNGKSTTDKVQSMRQILEKTSEKGISKFHFLISFNTSYDTRGRNKLFKATKQFKIPQNLISPVKLTLKHVRCRVKIQHNLSERFERKGNDLSCILFNLAW
jgi:sorting nexin-29